ncbi:MAG: LPS export ABC transporter periplasmic protein LptC [Cellvibrionaceae bacterium]
MSKGWILVITLFCAAILALLLWRSPPDELSGFLDNQTPQPNYPITLVNNALTKQYDEQGNLNYSLFSKTVHYYDKVLKDKPEAVFEEPRFIVYERQQTTTEQKTITQTLTISANTAEANQKQDRLILIGNVVLEQQNAQGEITQLRTERLQIHPDRRYAESSKPVIIKDKVGTTSATGLKVFFDDKRIELLSKVKGQYVPQ